MKFCMLSKYTQSAEDKVQRRIFIIKDCTKGKFLVRFISEEILLLQQQQALRCRFLPAQLCSIANFNPNWYRNLPTRKKHQFSMKSVSFINSCFIKCIAPPEKFLIVTQRTSSFRERNHLVFGQFQIHFAVCEIQIVSLTVQDIIQLV